MLEIIEMKKIGDDANIKESQRIAELYPILCEPDGPIQAVVTPANSGIPTGHLEDDSGCGGGGGGGVGRSSSGGSNPRSSKSLLDFENSTENFRFYAIEDSKPNPTTFFLLDSSNTLRYL